MKLAPSAGYAKSCQEFPPMSKAIPVSDAPVPEVRSTPHHDQPPRLEQSSLALDETVTLPTDRLRFDFSPWWFWREADERQRESQLRLQAALTRRHGFELAERCFVSELAA